MRKAVLYRIVAIVLLLSIFYVIGNESDKKVVPVIENTPNEVENAYYIPTACYSEGVEVDCKG